MRGRSEADPRQTSSDYSGAEGDPQRLGPVGRVGAGRHVMSVNYG
ncbi:hypothetical protein DESC_740201 [Desulfosarcina cetonica]|nr:hypothetical protein DESC_740201 [Desulfosarcina cetonica]